MKKIIYSLVVFFLSLPSIASANPPVPSGSELKILYLIALFWFIVFPLIIGTLIDYQYRKRFITINYTKRKIFYIISILCLLLIPASLFVVEFSQHGGDLNNIVSLVYSGFAIVSPYVFSLILYFILALFNGRRILDSNYIFSSFISLIISMILIIFIIITIVL